MAKDIKKLLDAYESEEEDKEDEEEPEVKEKPRERALEYSRASETPKTNNHGCIKLDLKDRKILYQLGLNARQPNSKLAKNVGLSKEVVHYRIKRLESQDIIKTYYPIIDLSALGYLSFRVYLGLIDASPQKEKEIINFLVKCKETLYVYDIEGPFDVAFGIAVKEIREFESFYNEFKDNFKSYMDKEQISLFTAVYHFNRNYLLEQKAQKNLAGIVGRSKLVEHDEIDWNILSLLSKNARILLTDIAEKLSIPERTVAFRIKRLEQKKIILGYKPLLDLNLLGYDYFKLDIVLKDTSKIKNLMNYAESNPFVMYIDRTIGGSDFEFDVEVKNKQQLLEIVEDLRTKFPEIREWHYFSVSNFVKLLYLPEN